MVWHWSVDVKKFQKENPRAFRLWRLEQLINYGPQGEKLSRKEIRKYWRELKERIDPEEKRLIEFFLWRKVYSLPPRKFFWEK
ncbi:hypothetical protein FJZ40_01125 [Candidatus Shapirobacteria bacterium]|nr:hypothetical protein [Candidatus Shapirobacteria bacterium]